MLSEVRLWLFQARAVELFVAVLELVRVRLFCPTSAAR